MTTPIRHIECGAIAMWYVGPPYEPAQPLRSADIVYIDGTMPLPCSPIPNCPACGAPLTFGGFKPNARRCFDEDIAPGFDIGKAIQSGERVSAVVAPNPAMMAALMRRRLIARVLLGVAVGTFLAVVFLISGGWPGLSVMAAASNGCNRKRRPP